MLPLAYQAGWPAATAADPEMAALYARHILLGDPEADAAVASLTDAGGFGLVRAGLEGGLAALDGAPEPLRAFFAALETPPDWFDPAETRAGCRLFHGHADMFLGAFVGAVLVEGFATLISKSFAITGRIVDAGVRRLQQNNRHLVEIFMPGGLERQGEGLRLSVRLRLVHARIRLLLRQSPEWDAASDGMPISAAHVGFSTAAFSGLLLERARMLGVRPSAEEEASFMAVWRYAGHLMGVPEALACGSVAQARRLHATGRLMEPTPGLEAVLLANALINAAPLVAGRTEAKARRQLATYVYRVSRTMIGDPLADALNFPPARGEWLLRSLRLRNQGDDVLRRFVPGWDSRRRRQNFDLMMLVSAPEHTGVPAHLPQRLHAEQDRA